MRIVDGLELRIVPAGISSHATRPLVNAAFDLERQDFVVSMCWISMLSLSVSDHTTMSVRAMIVMGIGEKCSRSTTPISFLSRNQVVSIVR